MWEPHVLGSEEGCAKHAVCFNLEHLTDVVGNGWSCSGCKAKDASNLELVDEMLELQVVRSELK